MTAWRRRRVASVESQDRVVFLDVASPSAVPMLLTGTALEVWDQLASGSEVEEAAIVGALADRFGVDEEDMAVDVAVFLRLLATSGAVEAVVRAR